MPESIDTTVSRRLAEFRKLQKMSQAQLAEKAGLSTEFVSRIERGVNSPSLQSLDKLSKVLGVHISELLDAPEAPENWEMEIEALVVLLKKKGKNIRKVFTLAEIRDDLS